MTLSGEWWIEDGQAMFADGDIGDMSHEAHVIMKLTREILDVFGVQDDSEFLKELSEYYDQLGFESIYDVTINSLVDSEELVAHWPNTVQRQAAVECVLGNGDARDYALVWDGWKRVKGNNVETWTLTADDLRSIADGLADTGCFDDDDDDDDDDSDRRLTVDIDVRGGVKAPEDPNTPLVPQFYQEVPLAVLEQHDIAALEPYRFKGWT